MKYDHLNTPELKTMLGNKERAANELQQWTARHRPEEEGYHKVVQDKAKLLEEMAEISAEIQNRRVASPQPHRAGSEL